MTPPKPRIIVPQRPKGLVDMPNEGVGPKPRSVNKPIETGGPLPRAVPQSQMTPQEAISARRIVSVTVPATGSATIPVPRHVGPATIPVPRHVGPAGNPGHPGPQAVPQRPAPAPPVVMEDPRLNKLLDDAPLVDPIFGISPRLSPRLRALLALQPAQWLDWGDAGLDCLQQVTDKQIRITQEISNTDVSRWIQETKDVSNKPPGLLDRLTMKSKPGYYEAKLKFIRDQLSRLIPDLSALKSSVAPRLETLRVDTLALQLLSTTLVDATERLVASNRLRALLSGQQALLQLDQQIQNTEGLALQHIGTIDTLLTSLIPSWKLMVSRA